MNSKCCLRLSVLGSDILIEHKCVFLGLLVHELVSSASCDVLFVLVDVVLDHVGDVSVGSGKEVLSFDTWDVSSVAWDVLVKGDARADEVVQVVGV